VPCHTAQLKTGKHHPSIELRNETIRPCTTMLLHDMWLEMADTRGEAMPKAGRDALPAFLRALRR
jgi:CxxC motif-containing protein (DUF1111 family)